MVVRLTEARLDAWRKRWPCSTLATGWVVFDEGGDLVDMGGRIARRDVDAHELSAFCETWGGRDRMRRERAR